MTNTTPRAALIDLDDTIIDFGGNAVAAWRSVCTTAAGCAGVDANALFDAIDRVRTWFWSDPDRHRRGRADLHAATSAIVEQALSEVGARHPDLAQRTAREYRELRNAGIRLFPGATAALERLRARDVRLALLTNGTGPDQRAKIERFGLAQYFDHIQIEGEFGCGKPEQRVYHAAMDAIGSAPADTWCVGDNLEWDVGAPQRLGVYGVWIDAPRRGLPPDSAVRPDRIIHSLIELL
jgi:putative hydrolase of the HAD superfamily